MSLVDLLQGDGGGYLALGLASQSVIQRGNYWASSVLLELKAIMWIKNLLSLFIEKCNAYVFN